MQEKIRVEGREEAQKAFQKVARDTKRSTEAAEAAGEALVPYIASLSRRETGAMAAGWGTVPEGEVSAAFINTEFYWTFQEFGTSEIDPMAAITGAWDRNQDVALKAYDKAISDIAENAGFEQ